MPVRSDSHQRLIAAILHIDSARRRDVRDQFVRALAVLLDTEPGFARSDVAADDIREMVAWCVGQPDGLSRLIDAVGVVEGSSPEVHRLRALISIGRPAEVLEPHERQLIEDLVAELDRATLITAFRDLASRWGPRLRTDPSDPGAVVRLLEDSISAADEPHPLYVFVRRLAELIRDPAREDIGVLANVIGARTGVSPGVMAEPPAEVVDPDQYYFVVRLTEHGLNASRYLLDVWLANEDGAWDRRYTADTAHSLEEVQAKVDELLTDLAEDTRVDVGELAIEFILPRSLLGHEVDQWIVAAPGVSSPIGVHYPVLVRDLTRMRNRIIRTRWGHRCDWLRRHGGIAVSGAVRFVYLNGQDTGLYADLMRDPEKPVCVVLLGRSAAQIATTIGQSLSAGIPVIVWCRDNQASSRFDEHLPGLLINTGVKTLPTAVWRLRQDAGGPGAGTGHVGAHITLLWDEQSRQPPDEQPLCQPA